METVNIVWSSVVREKLLKYRSEYFTAEEILDFITTLILDIAGLLKNEVILHTYTEEYGHDKGVSRLVV